MKTLQIWLVIILSPFAACALIWAFIETSSEESPNQVNPIIKPVPELKINALKASEDAERLDDSLREIEQMKDAQNYDPLTPDYGPPLPDPLPDYAIMGSSRPTTASTGTQFGQTTPEQRQKYEAIIAERLGIGAADPIPLTESELASALVELHALHTKMTLPAVEDPGPNRAPHTTQDDIFTLWQQVRTLKDAGEVSELAFRAIRNEHVTVTYQPLVYGEPREVESITAAQPKADDALKEAVE